MSTPTPTPKYQPFSMNKGKYETDGFAALIDNNKAVIIGQVRAGQRYLIKSGIELTVATTVEELKTQLTSKGATIVEAPKPE